MQNTSLAEEVVDVEPRAEWQEPRLEQATIDGLTQNGTGTSNDGGGGSWVI